MLSPSTQEPTCLAALPSMTIAIKGQRALLAAGISAEVLTLSASETRRGCGFGLSFCCSERTRAQSALRAARIPVSQYLKKGGEA